MAARARPCRPTSDARSHASYSQSCIQTKIFATRQQGSAGASLNEFIILTDLENLKFSTTICDMSYTNRIKPFQHVFFDEKGSGPYPFVQIANDHQRLRFTARFVPAEIPSQNFTNLSMLVRERSALADPYCHSACLWVCGFVGLCVRNFDVKYLGNQRS